MQKEMEGVGTNGMGLYFIMCIYTSSLSAFAMFCTFFFKYSKFHTAFSASKNS